MTYEFRPAKRSEAKPLIGLYSQSGAGKTYSALLLARGFVGPQGRIGMIETESGRGEAYADPNEYPELSGPGETNYDVLPLREDFGAAIYAEAITASEKAGLDALIIDSASHEWEGAGGVLEQAANLGAAGKKGVLMWQKPKMDHQRHFMLRFMQTPIPLVILCMRAKYPMKEVPDPRNSSKKTWVRLGDLEPKQSEDILFEMFVHGWVSLNDHALHVTKCTSKALESVFRDGQPITVETGRMLAEWARGDVGRRYGSAQPSSQAAGNGTDPLDEARAVARKGTKAFQDWWNGAGKTEATRAAVKPHMDEIKAIAAAADANGQDDEDPFGLTAPRETGTPGREEATGDGGPGDGGKAAAAPSDAAPTTANGDGAPAGLPLKEPKDLVVDGHVILLNGERAEIGRFKLPGHYFDAIQALLPKAADPRAFLELNHDGAQHFIGQDKDCMATWEGLWETANEAAAAPARTE